MDKLVVELFEADEVDTVWDQEDAYEDIDSFADADNIFQYHGNLEVVSQLNSLIEHRHLPHALLFSGEQGIGKASLAKYFSYSLLVDHPHITFVQHSDILDRMEKGSHLDYLYISGDKGGNQKQDVINVDQIRKISSFLATTRGEARKKIIVIDGAESMNANAANALLKNLEEPPANVLMILVSHSSHSLLPTIRSRVRNVKFLPLTDADCQAIVAQKWQDNYSDTPDDVSLAIALSENRPGIALKWIERGATNGYRRLLELFIKADDEHQQLSLVHDFTQELLADKKNMHAQFEDFLHLMLLFTKRSVSQGALQDALDAQEVQAISLWNNRCSPEQRVKYWFMIKEQMSLAQSLHLEYKNVLTTILLRLIRGQEPLAIR